VTNMVNNIQAIEAR